MGNLGVVGDEERFDGFLEHRGQLECQRQTRVVAAVFDCVDGLSGDPKQVTQASLAECSGKLAYTALKGFSPPRLVSVQRHMN